MNILAAILIASHCALASSASLGDSTGGATNSPDLSALCRGEQVGELTLEGVSSLIELAKDDLTACSPAVREALTDLGELLKGTKEDACARETALLIEDFTGKHLARQTLPRQLEEFVLSYAMQASRQCKSAMIEVLNGEANNLLHANDFARFGQWTRPNGQIDTLLKAVASSGVIVSPSELAMVLTDKKVEEKLSVNSALDQDVSNIGEVCAKRFKPIYRPLVRPLVALSHAGFDYPDRMLWSELKLNSKQIEQLGLWSRIIFLCETTDLMEARGRDAKFGDLAQVTFKPRPLTKISNVKLLSSEQLNELRQNIGTRTSTDLDQLRQELRQKLLISMQSQMDPEDARWFASCLNVPTESSSRTMVEDDNLEVVSSDSERQICGRPQRFHKMAKTLAIGAVIAGAMIVLGDE